MLKKQCKEFEDVLCSLKEIKSISSSVRILVCQEVRCPDHSIELLLDLWGMKAIDLLLDCKKSEFTEERINFDNFELFELVNK